MKNETQKIDGYWVIGTNKWSVDNYTKEEAEMHSRNCSNCINCRDCRNCINCSNCINCRNCVECSGCINCRYCHGCIDCSNCINCINCRYCHSCIDCSNCINCVGCSDCRDCHGCSNCSNCRYCSNCSGCSGFKTNPQRITSPKLGSRDSQTTFYWNNEKEQVVCGCYKGTLEEFKEKIKETHGDNEFAQGYFKWIDAVKFYKKTYGGNKCQETK